MSLFFGISKKKRYPCHQNGGKLKKSGSSRKAGGLEDGNRRRASSLGAIGVVEDGWTKIEAERFRENLSVSECT